MERRSRFAGSPRPRALAAWALLMGVGLALLLAAGRPAGAGRGQPLSPAGRAAAILRAAPPDPRAIPPAAGIARHQLRATIPLAAGIGQDPMAAAADPHGPLVYVANRGSSDITVLSGTRALGRVPAVHEGLHDGVGMLLAAHPTTGHLYALETTGARCTGPVQTFYLQEISATQVVTTTYLGGCLTLRRGCSADAMAFQPATGYLYLLRTYTVLPYPPHGTITILDGAAVLDEISLDNYAPSDVAADPVRGWVYVSSGYADNVLVFSGTAVVGTVPLTDAAAIAVQPRNGLAYVVSREAHLAVVSGTALLDRFPVAGIVADLAADPARGYLYVSYRYLPTLTVVSGTAVLTEVVVPAPGGALEVNAATGLVYLRHPDTSQVTVLSGTTVLTTVEGLAGSAPLASSPSTGLVYAIAGGEVAVLSGTRRLGALPPAAPRPRALAAHPLSGQVVVLSDPPALSWIADETLAATVPLTAAPSQLLVHPVSGLVYLALPDERSVLVFSGTAPLAAVPLAGPPVQLAVGPHGGPVYAADDSGVLTVISGTEALAALPLGMYGLAGAAVHPSSGLVYATDPWAHRVHVVSGTAVLTDVVMSSYPQAIAVEPRSGYVYVEVGGDGLALISGTRVTAAVDLSAGWAVEGLYAAPAGGALYVHERQNSPYDQCDRIEVYHGAAPVAAWTLPEGARYAAFALHPSLSYIYAGHAVHGSMFSVGVGTSLVETIPVGGGSWVRAVAVLPSGRVYAATDHEIAILEAVSPYRFYLPYVRRDPPAAPAPPAARYCRSAYDPDRRVVRLYLSADTWSPSPAWEYDGLAWRPLLTDAFPDLDWGGYAMAHDGARGVTLLGGLRENYYGDLWAYDGAAWARVDYFPLYTYSAMAYDPARERTVAFGGKWCERPGCAYFDRTWEYDGAAWAQAAPAHAPPPRASHALAYDPALGEVLLFGGGADGVVYSDTWAYDGVDWRPLTPTVAPPARAGHALAHDGARGVTVLFGGYGGGYLGDTWEYDGAAWREVFPAVSPPPRVGHALAYDEARGVTVLYGGEDAGRAYGDTWEYDGVIWKEVAGAR